MLNGVVLKYTWNKETYSFETYSATFINLRSHTVVTKEGGVYFLHITTKYNIAHEHRY